MTAQATPIVDTRELIVESAFACFGKQGLQKATIVDIAKRAGVSRSTIYEYFSDKASIVEACAEHASERFLSRDDQGDGRLRNADAADALSVKPRRGKSACRRRVLTLEAVSAHSTALFQDDDLGAPAVQVLGSLHGRPLLRV